MKLVKLYDMKKNCLRPNDDYFGSISMTGWAVFVYTIHINSLENYIGLWKRNQF